MKMGLPSIAPNSQIIGILDSGHYMFEEKPEQVLAAVLGSLQ